MARLKLSPWQVWWVDFDPHVGREQAKHRPAIVVGSRFHNSLQTPLGLVVPVTSTRTGLPYHVAVSLTPGRNSYAMTEQIKSFDHARFGKQIGHLDAHEIAAIRAILSRMVGW